MRQKIKVIITLLFLSILGIIAFLNYTYNNFKVDRNFQSISLNYNPYNNSSTYNQDGIKVTITGGFVKGKYKTDGKSELLLRALSPDPKILVKSIRNTNYTIRLENVNPVKTLANRYRGFKIINPHTISFNLKLTANQEQTIFISPENDNNNTEFVILGDNRNGYKTFSDIIDQINVLKPVFTIDNGDLVFGGEPNKYRLFNETVSKLEVPLFTTLGNHDIREGGRPIYTKLFGPPYYSFDYKNIHFIFLDTSRGFAEKRTIPEAQYKWLQFDLKKAAGKKIFVITHIPPTDPRSNIEFNKYPQIPGVQKTDWFEREMDNYFAYKNIDHAFPDKKEAKRFEDMMTKYKVDTVFLSHIHSYFSFIKGNVRYIISGGGGAELLTENSYYHYMRVKATARENYLEVIEIPSPANTYQDRILAALLLFASSIYKEYTAYVLSIGSLLLLLIFWLLWATRKGWVPALRFLGIWLYESIKLSIAKYKEMKQKRNDRI